MNGIYFRKAILVFPIKDDYTAVRFDELQKSGKLDEFLLEAFKEKIERELVGSKKQDNGLQNQVDELKGQLEALKSMFSQGVMPAYIPNKDIVQQSTVVQNQQSVANLIPENGEPSTDGRLVLPSKEEPKKEEPKKKKKKKASSLGGLDMGSIIGMAGAMDK